MKHMPAIRSAVSAMTLAVVLTGCAASLGRSGHAQKAGNSSLAFATRAQAALAQGDVAGAVSLAEQAVQASPDEALLRTLLGNSYFAAGRFASAESAYNDSLSLQPGQQGLFLKLALVQIAQGKNAQALAFLASVRPALEAADYGLAVALAGQPAEAVSVLEAAARQPGADSRVRQNLALAHGLAGDWQAARVIAAQDLAPMQVDERVQQWIAFASPLKSSDQVASLVGVTPTAIDPGQPVQLALARSNDVQMAAVAPLPQPVAAPVSAPVAQAPIEFAEAAPIAMPAAEPMPTADVSSVAAPEPTYVPPVLASVESKAPVSKPAKAAAVKLAEVRKASAPKQSRMPRKSIDSGVVVQLGAYSSASRVEQAWDDVSDRYSALRDFTPTSARFDSSKGTVYRLSVKGFASADEAKDFCASLKRAGKSCFVRQVAGDSPVRFASR